MKFVVSEEYFDQSEDFDTIEAARKCATRWATAIAGDEGDADMFPVTISIVVPVEIYKYVKPEPVEGSVKCECVTTTTRTCG